MLFEPLLNCLADRTQLRLALSRTQQKVFGEGASPLKPQHSNVASVLFLRRFHSETDFRAKRRKVQRHIHRYRACLRMYSSTRAGTSPLIP